jgi:hypothetical protein
MAFIRKSTWVMKPARGIESTTKPKTISYAKRGGLAFKEDQDKSIHMDAAARQNDFFWANEQLGSSSGVFGRAVDDSLQ